MGKYNATMLRQIGVGGGDVWVNNEGSPVPTKAKLLDLRNSPCPAFPDLGDTLGAVAP
jgi:hypothetical protein